MPAEERTDALQRITPGDVEVAGQRARDRLTVGRQAAGQRAHLLNVKEVHGLQEQLAEHLMSARPRAASASRRLTRRQPAVFEARPAHNSPSPKMTTRPTASALPTIIYADTASQQVHALQGVADGYNKDTHLRLSMRRVLRMVKSTPRRPANTA